MALNTSQNIYNIFSTYHIATYTHSCSPGSLNGTEVVILMYIGEMDRGIMPQELCATFWSALYMLSFYVFQYWY